MAGDPHVFTREHLAALESEYGPLFAGEPFDTRNDALVNVPTLPMGGIDHGIWSHLIQGYGEAAGTLIEQAMAGDAPHDLVVYPIVMLYRHHIELLIKHLYLLTGLELGEDTNYKVRWHDLTSLWLVVRERLPRVPEMGAIENVKVIDLVVGSYSEADERATTFRYPDEVQRLRLPAGEGRINLGHFRRIVLDASQELQACQTWLLELLFRKADAHHPSDDAPTG